MSTQGRKLDALKAAAVVIVALVPVVFMLYIIGHFAIKYW